MMNLGKKTIIAAVLYAVGQFISLMITDCPVESWVPWLKWLSGIFQGAGVILGAVGISDKFARASNLQLDQQREILQIQKKENPRIVITEPGFMDEIVISKRRVGSA